MAKGRSYPYRREARAKGKPLKESDSEGFGADGLVLANNGLGAKGRCEGAKLSDGTDVTSGSSNRTRAGAWAGCARDTHVAKWMFLFSFGHLGQNLSMHQSEGARTQSSRSTSPTSSASSFPLLSSLTTPPPHNPTKNTSHNARRPCCSPCRRPPRRRPCRPPGHPCR